ncbi:hypothetical protein DL769_008763 [Monosporascus sp. CRB-8-3]|nr:hypothetical protein DL769_008763 [Monosporascus sp. CRB-8-3]
MTDYGTRSRKIFVLFRHASYRGYIPSLDMADHPYDPSAYIWRCFRDVTRWDQVKGNLGLNATAKPPPEAAYKVRKGADKGKAAQSLATKKAAVGAAEDLGNLQDDTDRSEDETGPSPGQKA